MALYNILCLRHIATIGVWIEVPDAYMLDLWDGFELWLVVSITVPLGIFFVEGEWAFQDACSKQSTFKRH